MFNKIKYFLIFIFSFLLFNINVFAVSYTNTDTYFSFNDLYDYTTLNDYSCGSQNLFDYLVKIINEFNFEGSNYHIVFLKKQSSLTLYAIPKVQLGSYLNYTYILGGLNSSLSTSSYSSVRFYNNTSFSYYTVDFALSSGCLYNSYDDYNDLSNFLYYLNYDFIPNDFYFHNYTNLLFSNGGWHNSEPFGSYYVIRQDSLQTFSGNFASKQNSSIDLTDVVIPLYSTIPLIYQKLDVGLTSSTRTYYFKSIDYDSFEQDITFGDNFLIYCDLYDFCGGNNITNFIEYKDRLGTFYFNFSPNQVSNFNFNLQFDLKDITSVDYFNNIGYDWGCYARINNNFDYYEYIKFPYCDFEVLSNSSDDAYHYNDNYTNFNIYDSNNNVISDFSNYDKIFVYLTYYYKNDISSRSLNNLKYTFSIGNVYYEDNYKGVIYDNFDNLSSGFFKLFISTSKTSNYDEFYAKYSGEILTDRYFINKQFYHISNLHPTDTLSYLSSNFTSISISREYDLGIMFYNGYSDNNDLQNTPAIDFIFNSTNFIVSYNNGSTEDFFYFNDSTNSIIQNSIYIDYDNLVNDDYDISYYINKVNSFLYTLELDFYSISNLTQDFYDSIPIFFQDIILILFILFCLYFIYKLIKKV